MNSTTLSPDYWFFLLLSAVVFLSAVEPFYCIFQFSFFFSVQFLYSLILRLLFCAFLSFLYCSGSHCLHQSSSKFSEHLYDLCFELFIRKISCLHLIQIFFFWGFILFFVWSIFLFPHFAWLFVSVYYMKVTSLSIEGMVFCRRWTLIVQPWTSTCLSLKPLWLSESVKVFSSVVSDSVTQWTLTSVHETLQARILEWVAIPFSRGSSQTRDQTPLSHIAGRFCKPFDCLRKLCDCLSSLIHSWQVTDDITMTVRVS